MREFNVFGGLSGLITFALCIISFIAMNLAMNTDFRNQSEKLNSLLHKVDSLSSRVESYSNGYVEHDTVFVYQVKRDTIVEYKVISR